MGRTPKPLSFLVHPELYASDPGLWEKMREQGHNVTSMILYLESIAGYDLIIGRNCWRMFDLDGLNLAIKSARNTKVYPKKVKPKKPRKPRKKKEEGDD